MAGGVYDPVLANHLHAVRHTHSVRRAHARAGTTLLKLSVFQPCNFLKVMRAMMMTMMMLMLMMMLIMRMVAIMVMMMMTDIMMTMLLMMVVTMMMMRHPWPTHPCNAQTHTYTS